jgi:hypothetical protein
MSSVSTLLPPFALPALHADDGGSGFRGGSHRPARHDPRKPRVGQEQSKTENGRWND